LVGSCYKELDAKINATVRNGRGKLFLYYATTAFLCFLQEKEIMVLYTNTKTTEVQQTD
jgi:hypothetical protein